MKNTDHDKMIAKYLGLFNSRVFEYLTRITLLGVTYEVSQIIKSEALLWLSAGLSMVVGLQLMFDMNILFGDVFDKVGGRFNLVFKIALFFLFFAFSSFAFAFAFKVIDDFNSYYVSRDLLDQG